MKANEQIERDREDLLAVMSSPAGRRMLTNQLRNFGIGGQLSGEAGQLALYNAGVVFFRELAWASPSLAREILIAVYGLNTNGEQDA